MAKNKPKDDGHRNGQVRGKSQFLNPKTKIWMKRDTNTGQIIDGKQNGTPFK